MREIGKFNKRTSLPKIFYLIQNRASWSKTTRRKYYETSKYALINNSLQINIKKNLSFWNHCLNYEHVFISYDMMSYLDVWYGLFIKILRDRTENRLIKISTSNLNIFIFFHGNNQRCWMVFQFQIPASFWHRSTFRLL